MMLRAAAGPSIGSAPATTIARPGVEPIDAPRQLIFARIRSLHATTAGFEPGPVEQTLNALTGEDEQACFLAIVGIVEQLPLRLPGLVEVYADGALLALGETADKECRESLIALLGRLALAEEAPAGRIVRALLGELRRDSRKVRRAALAALGRVAAARETRREAAMVDAALGQLSDHEGGVRAAALELLAVAAPVAGASPLAADVEDLVTRFAADCDPAVRAAALLGALRLQQRGGRLPRRAYEAAVAALNDGSECVRLAAVRVVAAAGAAYGDETLSVERGRPSRLVDDAFAHLCNKTTDASAAVRALACGVLGGMHGVQEALLRQTLSKEVIAGVRVAGVAESGSRYVSSEGGDAGDDEAEAAAGGEGGRLLDSGAAGAFVHGLEDEFEGLGPRAEDAAQNDIGAVPAPPPDSLNHPWPGPPGPPLPGAWSLGLDPARPRAAPQAGPRRQPAGPDTGRRQVRILAIHSVAKICARAAALRPEQLLVVLKTLEDKNADVRSAVHSLLAGLRIPSAELVQKTIEALLACLQRNPGDLPSVYECVARLGERHAAEGRELMQALLRIDPTGAAPAYEPSDPLYAAVLVFLYHAAAAEAADAAEAAATARAPEMPPWPLPPAKRARALAGSPTAPAASSRRASPTATMGSPRPSPSGFHVLSCGTTACSGTIGRGCGEGPRRPRAADGRRGASAARGPAAPRTAAAAAAACGRDLGRLAGRAGRRRPSARACAPFSARGAPGGGARGGGPALAAPLRAEADRLTALFLGLPGPAHAHAARLRALAAILASPGPGPALAALADALRAAGDSDGAAATLREGAPPEPAAFAARALEELAGAEWLAGLRGVERARAEIDEPAPCAPPRPAPPRPPRPAPPRPTRPNRNGERPLEFAAALPLELPLAARLEGETDPRRLALHVACPDGACFLFPAARPAFRTLPTGPGRAALAGRVALRLRPWSEAAPLTLTLLRSAASEREGPPDAGGPAPACPPPGYWPVSAPLRFYCAPSAGGHAFHRA
eukprot:tig00001269_g7974.t1